MKRIRHTPSHRSRRRPSPIEVELRALLLEMHREDPERAMRDLTLALAEVARLRSLSSK